MIQHKLITKIPKRKKKTGNFFFTKKGGDPIPEYLCTVWPVSLGFSGFLDDFAFFGVLAVDIAALHEGFRRRLCGLMTIDDQVAIDFQNEFKKRVMSGGQHKTDTTEVVTYTHKKVTVRRNCSDFFPGYVAFIKPVYPK